MSQTTVRKTSHARAMTDVEVEPVDTPIRVELTGSIGGDRAVRIRVGQLSIGYTDGRVIVRSGLLEIAVWPCTAERARFAAGGHTVCPVFVESNAGDAQADGLAVRPRAPFGLSTQGRRHGRGAATPSGDPPLVSTGPGGDYRREYHG